MKKTALGLMIITVAAKIFGFVRDITLSYFYGVSYISDAYLISLTIPMVIFEIIGTGIKTSYIPVYSLIKKEKGLNLANKFTNNTINFIIAISSIVVVVVLLYTVPIVKLFAVGFEGSVLSLVVCFTKISIFAIYFYSLIYIFSGFLQMKNNFIVPAIMGIPLNFFIIIFIVISSKYNIVFLSIGTLIAVLAQLIFLIPFVYKKGYRYKFILNMKDYYLKKMFFLAIPAILGVSVNQINVLVDRTIASQITVGGISALNYANRLNLFIQSIFVMSIATVMYPMISKMAAERNIDGLKKAISECISFINFLVIPTTIGSMIFAKPVVKLLFGRGVFDTNAVSMTSYALFFYSIGMIGFGLREILSRTFYSLQDTKTPMINAAISIIINITLNIVLSKFLGIGGLALATSISAIFCTILLFVSLKKKIGSFGMKNITISFMKNLCASLGMGLVASYSFNYLTTISSENLSLIISIIIGVLTYFIMSYFLKVDDIDTIVTFVKRQLKKDTKLHLK